MGLDMVMCFKCRDSLGFRIWLVDWSAKTNKAHRQEERRLTSHPNGAPGGHARLVTRVVDATCSFVILRGMKSTGFTYWQDGDQWIGHLDEFPDYLTQGISLEDLKAHLADLYQDLTSGVIPNVRRHAELEMA